MQLGYGRLLLLEYRYSLVERSNGREVNFGSFDFEIEKVDEEMAKKSTDIFLQRKLMIAS